MITSTPTTPIKTQNIFFTGKSYSKKNLIECEEFIEKTIKTAREIKPENYRAYTKVNPFIRLEKSIWGFKIPKISKELEKYNGTLKKIAGFSTEAGGYGGGWIKASTKTPLSTKDVHTCALLNLVNENTSEQLMYHVYAETRKNSIEYLIKKEFPSFTKVNIMPGDQHQTNNTVNEIIKAIDNINPKATKEYYHIPIENPEVIAIDGKLKYIENTNHNDMTFTQITNQYNY